MDKKDFLEELNRHLLVLEDEEQQDILEEYSQHIDLKVESGLTEEEAIRDFGSIRELAAEILEAYHVKAEFSGEAKRAAIKLQTEQLSQQGKKFGERIVRFFKRLPGWLKSGFHTCAGAAGIIGRKITGLFRRPWEWIGGFLHRGEERSQTAEDRRQIREEKRELRRTEAVKRPGFLRSFGAGAVSAVGSCTRGILHLCLWGIRWCWNLFMIFLALFGGVFALGTVFCFAVLLVWLLKGYPLTGITMILLGSFLCSGAFTVFCFSLIRAKSPKQSDVRADEFVRTVEITEEVHDA